MEINTPTGTNKTAVDKFVLQYVNKGFSWHFENNNIIFIKDKIKIIAQARFNKNGWVCGYGVRQLILE